MTVKARKIKACQEEPCQEQWDELSDEVRRQCASFIYCPFCANEMVTRCEACGETIHDFNFQFCPWCGAEFGE